MTGQQRVLNTFNRQPVDRRPVGEDYWAETLVKWAAEGYMKQGEVPAAHFNYDLDRSGFLNYRANLAHGWKTIEENETSKVLVDPNGATVRAFKNKSGLEHLSYLVKDQQSWESFAKPHLVSVDLQRIPFEAYRKTRADCLAAGRFFLGDGWGPFEFMREIIGHETLLTNIALEPDWIKDMVSTYWEFNIMHWEELFRREGMPQGMWIGDDLGYKFTPFMSVAMFEDVLLPGYVRYFQWLREKGIKINVMHSCGYVESFLPLLCDAGLTCLEGLEVKAGMDIIALNQKLGDRLVWFGNIDIRALESNDRALIDKEIEKLRRVTREGGRCMVHSDHSISPLVEYDTYRYFIDAATTL